MQLGSLVIYVTHSGVHLPAWVTGWGSDESLDLFTAGPPHLLAGRVCEHLPAVPRDDSKGVCSWHPTGTPDAPEPAPTGAVEGEEGSKGGSAGGGLRRKLAERAR